MHPFGKWSNVLPHLAQKVKLLLRFREPELVWKLNKNLITVFDLKNSKQAAAKHKTTEAQMMLSLTLPVVPDLLPANLPVLCHIISQK